MLMDNWADVVVQAETSLRAAIATVDKSGHQVALVVAADGSLLGILTDGDIRRAVLAGTSLEKPVSEVMGAHPVTAAASTPREEVLALMRRKNIHHLPLVDGSGHVAGLVTLGDFMGVTERPNWVVLMVGGLGTRLHPLTEDVPKPLLPVGGKPILETILESFAEQGFRRIFLAVNYKAAMIREYFGSGERWGLQVEYLHERSRLGTAGALSLLPGTPSAPVIVMNGDLVTRTDFDSLLRYHHAHGAAATMAVREYDIQVPYGVVRLDGAWIRTIDEKPVERCFVNAGIYALSPHAMGHLPPETFFDMPTLFEHLIAAGETTAAYPLREYWLDVGRVEALERAEREWGRDLP